MASKSKRIINLLNSSSPLLLLGTSALLAATPAHAFDANSLPSGGTVTGGAASLAQSGNTLTVNQSSNRAIIDWRSFDIGANAQANFNQPGASSIAVNRVNASTDPTRIDGGLHANGQVWILNPNGVMFGKTARVDAAGVVATTANIDDRAFMAGDNKLQMRGGDTGSVVNEGHITVGEGGLAAFVAPSVRNSGSIRARVGKVALAAGDTYTLDLAGDRLVEIGLGAGKAMVDQSGQIINEGGTVTISAKAAGAAVDSLINMSGLTDASSVQTAGGQIILGGDDINVASSAVLKADGVSGGQITAVASKSGTYAGSYSAQGTSGNGGQIETSGKTVHIDNNIAVNTQSAQGKTGNWTLDPDALTVTAGSGSAGDDATSTIGADTVVAALDTTDVTLMARNSITVDSAINASANTSAHNLALSDQDGGGLTINLNAAITLKSGGVLSGDGSIVNVGATGLVQNGVDVASLTGTPTVNLANGATYREQVVITKNLTLNGGNATLESPDILAHSFSSGGVNRKAVLSIEGANASVSDLTVDGRGQGSANNFFIGVGLHNAGGSLSNLTVKGIRDGGVGGSITGVQHGVGVAAYNDDGASRTVSLSGSTISDYQKNAALFTGHGLTANVTGNTVTGAGATATIAQNGILFVGAAGSISGNTISGIGYSPDTVWATAIYLSDAAGTTVSGNTVHGAGGITGSTLGLYAGGSDGVTVSNNSFLNVEQGIDLASANANINNNHFTDSGAGIELEDSATGFSITGNDFTNNKYQIYADSAGADLNALIGANTLDRSVINASGATTVYGNLQTAIDEEAAGSTLNLTGTFAAGATVNKAGDTLSGHGAVINASTHTTGLTIAADNVTVEGIEFAGNVTTPYTAADWNDAANQGVTAIAVSGNTATGASGFNIAGNNIHDVRTGIIVQGASASGAITGNTVENTKGGILVQYNDGAPYTISGNSEGAVGNEWGIVVNLNTAGINSPGAAPLSAQQNLLALADGNNGMAAMDRHYAEANRTRVVVDASSTATAADDGGHGNGLGNARQALSSIQDGIDAVVTGGVVNVTNGIYREQVVIARDMTLNGGNATLESPDILAHSFSSGGVDRKAVLSVEGANATISDLTVDGRGQGSANNFFIGVGLHNAGGSLSNLIVKGIRDGGVAGSITGGQHGVGVAVYNDDGATRTVSLSGSAISDYQKNGALFTGHGLTANVSNNTITGVGPTATIAQNGILFVGATGSIDGNTISGVGYSPDTVWATAIYLDDAAGTSVSGNIVNGAGGITGSTLGLYAGNSDGVTVSNNSFLNVEQGIDLNSANATINNNHFRDSGAGIELEAGATNLSAVDNDFTNNLYQVYADVAGTDLKSLMATNNFDRSVLNDAGGTTIYGGLQLALDNEAAGSTLNVGMGTYNENVTVAAPVTLNFDDVTLDSLDIAAGASGTILSGSVKAGSVTAFDINLGGDLSIDTSATGGTIALAAVDGAHALTLNAGAGVALVGSIGANTRLGAVDIAADLIGLGAVNKAASFNLDGDVALSAASTLIDTTVSSTAAGAITFGGDIFGVTDGGQSLVISAGPGTGAASANGDITMNNAGLSAVRLGNLSVSGNNFTALTVDIAGNFNSQLTGNQLFAADTLNAGGNVVSNAAGNVTGHIVAGGNVNLNSGGTISGVLVGQTVSLTAQVANAQVTANTLNVNAKSGTITGTFTPGTISGGFSLASQGTGTGSNGGSTGGATTVRFPTVNGQQLVVQDFLLPAGTQIAADGTLILPTGLVIGLLSPGGGPARVIMVNDVRTLGQLLSEGYSAIVIDLNSKKSGEVQVASN